MSRILWAINFFGRVRKRVSYKVALQSEVTSRHNNKMTRRIRRAVFSAAIKKIPKYCATVETIIIFDLKLEARVCSIYYCTATAAEVIWI